MKKNEKTIFKNFGPALLVLALGIGSGELIMWPFLSANYGFGIMWGALLGISLQLFLISIISRNTIILNESILVSFKKVFSLSFLWIIFSTIIGFGWPGFSSLTAELLTKGFHFDFFGEKTFFILSIFILTLSGFILIFSKNAYKKILFLEKIMMSLLFILTTFLFIYYFIFFDFLEMLRGFFGIGNEYLFFPKNINMEIFLATFLGAIVYAGSGGNLILGNSFFVLKENKNTQEENKNKTIKNIFNQNLLFFWFGGIVIISMLSYVSHIVLKNIPAENLSDNFNFLILESEIFNNDLGIFFGNSFIFLGAFALFGVQLGILDFIGRIVKNYFKNEKKDFLQKNKISQKMIYNGAVFITVFLGIFVLLLGFDKPKTLIVLGAILNAFSMGAMALLLFFVEIKIIPKEYKSNKISVALILTAIFYLLFFGYVFIEKFL